MKLLITLSIPIVLSISAIAGAKHFANSTFINDDVYTNKCIIVNDIDDRNVEGCMYPFEKSPIFFNGMYCGVSDDITTTDIDAAVVNAMPSLCSITIEGMQVAFFHLQEKRVVDELGFEEWLSRRIDIVPEENKTALIDSLNFYF